MPRERKNMLREGKPTPEELMSQREELIGEAKKAEEKLIIPEAKGIPKKELTDNIKWFITAPGRKWAKEKSKEIAELMEKHPELGELLYEEATEEDKEREIEKFLPGLKSKVNVYEKRSESISKVAEITRSLEKDETKEPYIKELLPMLKDEDPNIRGRISKSLYGRTPGIIGSLEKDKTKELYIKEGLSLLKDEKAWIRRDAVGDLSWTIGTLENDETIETYIKEELLPTLKDEDENVRNHARNGLDRLIGELRER